MDTAALDEIREAMGEARTLDLLALVAADLNRRFGSEASQDLAFDAHAMPGTAGLFGVRMLAGVCREVEAACQSGAALHHIESMRRFNNRF